MFAPSPFPNGLGSQVWVEPPGLGRVVTPKLTGANNVPVVYQKSGCFSREGGDSPVA